MFVALSFAGKLPEYVLDCVHQLRLFYDGDIVIILDDMNSPYLSILEGKYRVIPIKYEEVKSHEFIECFNQNRNKFILLPQLKGREWLFVRCFERFFLLGNAMKLRNLTDCFFIELDNLIYDDPRVWLSEFQKWNMCFMFDNYERASSGVTYIKNAAVLDDLLNYTIQFIHQWVVDPEVWMSEMVLLYKYYLSKNDNTIQFLPTIWPEAQCPVLYPSENYEKYNKTIFDAAAIGIMLYGSDTGNKDSPTVVGTKNRYSFIDYTVYLKQVVWRTDDKKRHIPYFLINGHYIKINNLHIHCKNLTPALSIPR